MIHHILYINHTIMARIHVDYGTTHAHAIYAFTVGCRSNSILNAINKHEPTAINVTSIILVRSYIHISA